MDSGFHSGGTSKRHSLLREIMRVAQTAPEILPAHGRTAYPLSTGQQRLWFLQQATPESAAYNVPLVVHICGDLKLESLENCIKRLIERHSQLRARFIFRDGEAVCEVGNESTFALVHGPACKTEPAEWDTCLNEINEFVQTPFDLENGPVVKAMVVRLRADEHLFALVFHHAVCEAWSVAILMRELEKLYLAEIRGEQIDLEPLPIQFGDFAIWERESLTADSAAESFAYWRDQLEGLPTLQFPTDRTRPSIQTLSGELIGNDLSYKTISKLESFATSNNVTPFVVMLSAMDCLLYKYTGQSTVVVGCPVSNRDREELQGLVGFFVNTLVLKSEIEGTSTFLDLVSQVKDTVLEALSNKWIPFEVLVDELQTERDLSRNPLFQIMFALQNTPLPSLSLDGTDSSRVLRHDEVHTGTSRVDLSIVIEPAENHWTVWAEYNTDLFEKDTVERFLAHYEILLLNLLDHPRAMISGMSVLTENEYQQMVVEWNKTDAPLDSATIIDLFALTSKQYGDLPAVRCAGKEISYAELSRDSDRLAAHLQSRNVQANDVVAVRLERSIELVVSLVGILKAGATYLPIDPNYPIERAKYMLSDSGSSALISNRRWRKGLDDITLIDIDRDLADSPESPEKMVRVATEPSSIAYIIYTSGSTGAPKGVEVTHKGLCNLVSWHQKEYEIGPDDIATLIASPAFDASVWELWPNVTAGACLTIPDEETRLSPEALISWLVEERVTVCFLPTPLAEALLAEPWPAQTSLRALLTGGDQLHEVKSSALPFRVVNHYGPTENTVVTTFSLVDHDGHDLPPIGRPIANTEVYILDRDMNPVPVGVIGMLYIAGVGLARGYRNRQELTAKSFLRNPFPESRYRTMYKTGDLCRYRRDGQITFEGRADAQVKIRGFRVELGEIESVLRAQDKVDEAAVMLRADSRKGHEILVAYVVAQSTVAELRKSVAARLPQYMCPQIYVSMSELPITVNGKVDWNALPEPWANQEILTKNRPPETEAEKVLATIWGELLGVDGIGIEDNFFDLGGNSLMAVQVVHWIRERLDVHLSLLVLLSGSLGQAAEVVRELRSENGREQSSSFFGSIRKAVKNKIQGWENRS